MSTSTKPEAWLRGPIDGIPSLLMPVAHALQQATEEVDAIMINFPEERLWDKPAGLASAGFHLKHLTGVIDRLFTYTRGQSLDPKQLEYLKMESEPGWSSQQLIQNFKDQVQNAFMQLAYTKTEELLDFRGVGRAHLPSNVLGLLVHSAEHTMRHVGQLLVTVRILKPVEASS